MRRTVMFAAGALLLVEAAGVALVNLVLGVAVEKQNMSLAGSDPSAMSVGAWITGGLAALYLAAVAVVLFRAGLRDRAPGRPGRILVVVTTVGHGVVGALAKTVTGWTVFLAMMVVLGLLILVLVLFREDEDAEEAAGDGGAGAGGGSGAHAPA